MGIVAVNVRVCLDEISTRLSDAAAIARAAVTCADSGSEREALRIAMDLDELLHEVTTLHGAMVLFGRMQRRAEDATANT